MEKQGDLAVFCAFSRKSRSEGGVGEGSAVGTSSPGCVDEGKKED